MKMSRRILLLIGVSTVAGVAGGLPDRSTLAANGNAAQVAAAIARDDDSEEEWEFFRCFESKHQAYKAARKLEDEQGCETKVRKQRRGWCVYFRHCHR
jgi:hypothetical protein